MTIQLTGATHLLNTAHRLGEGPTWHPHEERLYWVNIEDGELHRSDADGGNHQCFALGQPVGSLAFRRQGGLVLATRDGFATWSAHDPVLHPHPAPSGGYSGRRFNDGKVDPLGRFVAGTLSDQAQNVLYRLDPSGQVSMLDAGFTICNGLDWSPDKRWFYFTDTPARTIYRYRFDPLTGELSDREPFIVVPDAAGEGAPDGLCVDAEGCIWSARWGGWKVVRYDPDGRPIAEVPVPVAKVTCCAFGGTDLDTLFITTARDNASTDELRQQPAAGDLFAIRQGVTGQAVYFFGG